MRATYRDRTAWSFQLTATRRRQGLRPLRIRVQLTIVLRGIESRIRTLKSRGERDVDRLGGRVEAFLVSSDGNLLEELVVMERDISHDVGATLALGSLFRRGDLAEHQRVATKYKEDTNKITMLGCRSSPSVGLRDKG